MDEEEGDIRPDSRLQNQDGDDPTTNPSKLQQITSSVSQKFEKIQDNIKKEIQEELEENCRYIKDARETATDLADPETIQTFIKIIKEKPENPPAGCDKKLWLYIVWKFITSVCLKLLDIGTDIAAASEHFERKDYKYGAFTLFFVYLPGFVLSAAMTIWGLFYKEVGEPPQRKVITCERVGRYMLLLFLFPLAYPLVQIALALLLVILLIRRQDKEPKRFMGHDLSQFKSLEGFLESGPSFCLQAYILMLGRHKGENIDWSNIRKDDLERVALLSLSSLMSFINLTKTAYKVNVPDPDERRKQPQYPENSRCFKLTLLLFSITCILFRLFSISYFGVYLRNYALILIFAGFLVNVVTFLSVGCIPTISIILGAISLFVPNGYLLYNFAGTLEVDLSRRKSGIVFLVSTTMVNIIWAGGLAAVYGMLASGDKWLIRDDIFFSSGSNEDVAFQLRYIFWFNSVLGIFCILSVIMGFVHWYVSIVPIFEPPEDQPETLPEENLKTPAEDQPESGQGDTMEMQEEIELK